MPGRIMSLLDATELQACRKIPASLIRVDANESRKTLPVRDAGGAGRARGPGGVVETGG